MRWAPCSGWRVLPLVLCLAAVTPVGAHAQDSASAAPAAEVARLLDSRGLGAFAAPFGREWVAALYLAGSELVVVKGVAGSGIEPLAAARSYREIYIHINSAADPATKLLVSDVGADGLRAGRNGRAPADTAEAVGRSYVFDGEWARAGLTEGEYGQAFRTVDREYAVMLQALLVELRRVP